MAFLRKIGAKFYIRATVDGRKRDIATRSGDIKVARAMLAQYQAEASQGRTQFVSKTPLVGMIESFAAHTRARNSLKLSRNDISRLRTVFGPICPALVAKFPGQSPKLKAKPIEAKTAEQVTSRKILDHLQARISLDGLSPRSANDIRETLHRMFGYAKDHLGYINPDRAHDNPVDGVKTWKHRKPPIDFLERDQIVRYLATIDPDEPDRFDGTHDLAAVIRAAAAVMIYAGLRREEVLWLEPKDIDTRGRTGSPHGYIRIHSKNDPDSGEFWQPKTGRDRIVPISPQLHRELERYRKAVRPSSPWYFMTTRGMRWGPDRFSGALRRHARKAGIKAGARVLRHTFASQLAQSNKSAFTIASYMGNSPQVVESNYASMLTYDKDQNLDFMSEDRSRKPGRRAKATA